MSTSNMANRSSLFKQTTLKHLPWMGLAIYQLIQGVMIGYQQSLLLVSGALSYEDMMPIIVMLFNFLLCGMLLAQVKFAKSLTVTNLIFQSFNVYQATFSLGYTSFIEAAIMFDYNVLKYGIHTDSSNFLFSTNMFKPPANFVNFGSSNHSMAFYINFFPILVLNLLWLSHGISRFISNKKITSLSCSALTISLLALASFQIFTSINTAYIEKLQNRDPITYAFKENNLIFFNEYNYSNATDSTIAKFIKLATIQHREDILNIMTARGVDMKLGNTGTYGMYWAARKGNIVMMKYYIEDLSLRKYELSGPGLATYIKSNSIAFTAAEYNQLSILEYLDKQGHITIFNADDLAYAAVKRGAYDTLTYLIEKYNRKGKWIHLDDIKGLKQESQSRVNYYKGKVANPHSFDTGMSHRRILGYLSEQ